MNQHTKQYYGRHEISKLEKLYMQMVYKIRVGELLRYINSNQISILDVGCGKGEFLRLLPKQFTRRSGIDLAAPSSESNITFISQDFYKYKFKEKYNVITAHHIIEHVEDSLKFLKRIYELLDDGGVACITTPNTDSIGYKIGGKDWFHSDKPFHKKLFNSRELKQQLEICNFHIKELRGEFPGFPFDMFYTLKRKGKVWLLLTPVLSLIKYFYPETLIAICIKP